MNKQLLLLAILSLLSNAAEEQKKVNRTFELGNKIADVSEHATDYIKALEKHNTPIELLNIASPEPVKWGLSSLIFGSSKPAVKVTKTSVNEFDILKSMKIHGFNKDALNEQGLIYKIENKEDFLKLTDALGNNNFQWFGYRHTKNNQWITHLFIGAMAQKDAVNYYFAKKIAKVMAFELPAYVSCENNNQIVQYNDEYAKYHASSGAKFFLKELLSYICTHKNAGLTAPLTQKEKDFLSSFHLIEYNQEKHSFALLTDLQNFTQDHLKNILQGKFYRYDTSTYHTETSTISKGKSSHTYTRVFIGEGVSDKTPHDYCISQL